MQIQKTNNAASFGNLYIYMLKPSNSKLIKPVVPKLRKIAEKVDLLITNGMDEIERGTDYTITMPSIRIFASKKNTGIFSESASKTEIVFTNTYTNDELLRKTFSAARAILKK